MSFEPRTGKPYIWVTWLTGLVAGEKSCQWAAWFRAHHSYDKRPDENESNLTRWKAEHGEMVRAEADGLRAEGWTVSIEDQNKFTYRGKIALVGGKPDVIATRERTVADDGYQQEIREAYVVDAKSGRERDADAVQVAVYMLLAPHDLADLKDRTTTGAVRYRQRVRTVTADAARKLQDAIVGQVTIVAGDIAPPRTPSEHECRFCDIADCPERIVVDGLLLEDAVSGAIF